MNSRNKLFASFVGIILIAAASAWMVYPKGSKIDLTKAKIKFSKEYKIHLGLDLQGGSSLTYQADFSSVKQEDQAEALNSVRDIIERRVNSFGVSEPQVQVSGKDRIVVELPGIKDINEAINKIGQTPILDFRVQNPEAANTKPNEKGEIAIDANSLWLPSGLSGKNLKKAVVDFQSQGKLATEVVVSLEFDEQGAALFEKITKDNLNKQVAIFLDGQIISAPTVQAVITSGKAVINGNFTTQTAKELATRLNSGALPVPVKLISQQNVGATLGQESVKKSLVAGCLGLLMIAIFMLTFYRLPGLLAVCALVVYTLVSIAVFKIGISFTAVVLVGAFFFLGLTVSPTFGIFSLLSYLLLLAFNALSPVTLTLAGIAGFILSIGMAVDANILIFERLKEEIRSGKDIPKAVEDGFARAWLSIRDSNVSSLITTVILYWFGTPSIKGFAVTLSIGILISMFTAITVTKTFLKLFLTAKLANKPWLFGVSSKK